MDRGKWPDGLGPFIERVDALGMTFGLWDEPEVPDRDLHRAHPEWVRGPPDQVLDRHQLCLDLSRDEVRDHLFAQLDALLTEYQIDHLKWDHNRLLSYLSDTQTRGLYGPLDRLRAARLAVEIESGVSGGGRIDLGVLARAGQVWLAASNDALERLRFQHSMGRICEFVAENFREDIDSADIALSADIHPKYAMSVFKKSTGVTPIEYVSLLRLSHAQAMLMQEDANVLQVAMESGFGSRPVFNKCFGKMAA